MVSTTDELWRELALLERLALAGKATDLDIHHLRRIREELARREATNDDQMWLAKMTEHFGHCSQ